MVVLYLKKSACIDKIKEVKENINYLDSIKSFCEGIIKSACEEIIKSDIIYVDSINNTCVDNLKNIFTYADSAKSTCVDNIKSNFTYAESAKSTSVDNIKNIFAYVNSAKSACIDNIKSTIVNIIYIDIIKSTCADNVKSANIKINMKNNNITRVYCKNINNKSTPGNINNEFNALLKLKKVSATTIIIKKKLKPQVINIKYELNALLKIKKVTNASKNVIAFLNKQITQIIKGNKVHTHNEINNTTTHIVIHDIIKKAHAKLPDSINNKTILINKVHIENNSVDNVSNISKKTHKKLFENVLKQIKSHNNAFDYDKWKKNT